MSDFSIKELDSTKEFDGIASVYVKGRPAYAEGFTDDLYNKLGITTAQAFHWFNVILF